MKTTAAFLLAASALASAQVTYDEATGIYTCDKPNVAYCAGDSLKTDIIIRCDANRRGQPGRCSDNLVGQFPVGNKPALCFEAAKDGSAACEKNCVVYAQPPFTLPAAVCTPSVTPPTTTITYVNPSLPAEPTTTITFVNPAPPAEPTTTITFVNPSQPNGGGKTTLTTTYVQPTRGGDGDDDCPPTTTITYVNPSGTPPPKPSNGTNPSGTRTPPPTVPTGAASANQVGGMAFAAVGLAAAYFL